MRLTEKALQAISSDRRRDYLVSDKLGLILRVSPAYGGMSKVFRFRWKRDGRQSVVNLGDYGTGFRLTDANALHGLCRHAADNGGDPRAVVEEWHRKHSAPAMHGASGPTVKDVVAEFLAWAERERKRPEAAKYLLEKDVLPYLGDRPASSIRKRDIVVTLDRIIARGSPVLANRVQAVLKQAFAVAADRDLIEVVPPFPRAAAGGEETARTRTLSDAEITLLWHGLDLLTPTGKRGKGITRPLALALKLTLVTAQRRGEIAGAKWSDITEEPAKGKLPKRSTWHIADTKSDRPHSVPLSPLAESVLAELREITGNTEHWLPSATGEKAADDRDRTITRAAREVRDRLQMAEWTPHDLRRTARTNFARLGIAEPVAERILNHSARDPMVAVYNQHRYQDEMRDALNKWGAHLQKIIKRKFTLPPELAHLAK